MFAPYSDTPVTHAPSMCSICKVVQTMVSDNYLVRETTRDHRVCDAEAVGCAVGAGAPAAAVTGAAPRPMRDHGVFDGRGALAGAAVVVVAASAAEGGSER